jgi:hypothetical protein
MRINIFCGGALLATLVLLTGGCPSGGAGALGLQDWGRDLLSIPASVIIAELIDEAQGTNTPIDPNVITNEVIEQINSGQTIPGVPGPAGADGKDGVNGTNGTNGVDGKDGTNGVDGANGVDGKDGTNGADGTNGVDGVNGVDGRDFYAVALGCITDAGTRINGYGFNARKVAGENGVYAVALIGYDFPGDFDPNNLVVLVTPDAIVQQQIVTSYESGVGFGFLVEFRDVWLDRTNTEFCFAVYDVSTDPYESQMPD